MWDFTAWLTTSATRGSKASGMINSSFNSSSETRCATAPSLSVTEQITQAKERIRRKSNCKKFIAYFQAYTNTYAPVSYLRELFTEAIAQPDIAALSIATRCDCLPPEVLDLLSELNCDREGRCSGKIAASPGAAKNTAARIQCPVTVWTGHPAV